MKNKVIQFLQELPEAKQEQFNQAFELYRQSEGKNLSAERNMNVTGYSPGGLDNLLYDLQKLHNISDAEKFRVIKLDVVAIGGDGDDDGDGDDTDDDTDDGDFDGDGDGTDDKGKNIVPSGEALVGFLTDELKAKAEAEAKGKTDVEVPINETSLRVEFPFLSDKECPDEMKILVADKITAWKLYLETQERIKNFDEKISGADELSELSKIAIEAFDENQKIYDELNVFATTGKILGVHPIFKKLQLLREVEAMTTDELIKYKSASAKYFSDNNKGLANANRLKNTVKAEEIKTRVLDRKDKLFLVNKKLGV